MVAMAARPATDVVTGQTVTISGGTLYATQINVDFGSSQWHGVEWRSGATSLTPLTVSAGVMSTPLVPYRSVSVPWFYPIVVLLPVAFVWIAILLRRAVAGDADIATPAATTFAQRPIDAPSAAPSRRTPLPLHRLQVPLDVPRRPEALPGSASPSARG